MNVGYNTILRITGRYIEARMMWVYYENRATANKHNDAEYNTRRAHESAGNCSATLEDLSDIIGVSTDTIDEYMRSIIGEDLNTENVYKYGVGLLYQLGVRDTED